MNGEFMTLETAEEKEKIRQAKENKKILNENLMSIINFYGAINQLKKLSEEVFEFQQAVIEYDDEECKFYENIGSTLKEHVEEEYADCMVLMEQFKNYYKLDKNRISKIMKEKAERQIERINNE